MEDIVKLIVFIVFIVFSLVGQAAKDKKKKAASKGSGSTSKLSSSLNELFDTFGSDGTGLPVESYSVLIDNVSYYRSSAPLIRALCEFTKLNRAQVAGLVEKNDQLTIYDRKNDDGKALVRLLNSHNINVQESYLRAESFLIVLAEPTLADEYQQFVQNDTLHVSRVDSKAKNQVEVMVSHGTRYKDEINFILLLSNFAGIDRSVVMRQLSSGQGNISIGKKNVSEAKVFCNTLNNAGFIVQESVQQGIYYDIQMQVKPIKKETSAVVESSIDDLATKSSNISKNFNVSGLLSSKSSLVYAIMAKEILGPPKAFSEF